MAPVGVDCAGMMSVTSTTHKVLFVAFALTYNKKKWHSQWGQKLRSLTTLAGLQNRSFARLLRALPHSRCHRLAAMADLLHALRRACQYHTGYPKERRNSAVYNFHSERQFVDLLQQGSPVVVAFTLRCAHTRVLDQALEDAAAEWHPHVRFMRVECPMYPGFCIARERTDYPFIEIFLSSKEKAEHLQEGPASISKYQVSVMPFTYDVSAYGFREFLKKHGIGGGGGTS